LKRIFSDENGGQYVKFGSPRDNDPEHGIKAGKLMLTGQQVSGFFEPSIQSTVDSIRENFTEILALNSFAFLVGGFASSPWLTSELNRRLSDLGLTFFKPDTNTNKAVAVGAISFYIDRSVRGRISKFAYGTPRIAPYNASDPEHLKREHKTYTDVLGAKYVHGAFGNMLSKGTKVLENREIRRKVRVACEGAPQKDVLVRIVKYDGNLRDPEWMDVEPDRFETLCHVAADISAAPSTPKPGKSGKMYYSRKYDIVLLVGLTELKAQIRWVDSITGTETSSDAVIVYNDGSENACAGSRVVPPPDYDDLDF